jgi:hypothetical protein
VSFEGQRYQLSNGRHDAQRARLYADWELFFRPPTIAADLKADDKIKDKS